MTEQPAIQLPVKLEEIPVLRFALDHALHEISEAHPEDRAELHALIERLEAAERKFLVRNRRRERKQSL